MAPTYQVYLNTFNNDFTETLLIIFKALLQQRMIHPTEQFLLETCIYKKGKQKTVFFRSVGGDLPALDINISFQERERPGRGGDINDFILGR